MRSRQISCCFTGHRPGKLPWRYNEKDPRCLSLKRRIADAVETAYEEGCRHFLCGMALGCDLYFCEAVLALRESRPDVTVEAAIPCPTQAERWPEPQRRRWRAVLERCDLETVVQQYYNRFCMFRRDRYMVDRSAAILAVFDGMSGGTQYTLNYAMDKKLEILLLDPLNPGADAVRLTI